MTALRPVLPEMRWHHDVRLPADRRSVTAATATR